MTYKIKTLSIIITFLSFFGFSQKIDTVTYKGELCYVYPFKINVRSHQAYFNSIIVNKKHFNAVIDLLKNDQWKDLPEEQLELALKLFKKQVKQFKALSKKENNHHLNKAIRQNPYPLIEQKYEFDVDIKPCLDNIPDGKYIQYFYDFALINPKNELELIKNKVGGVFEIKNNVLHGNAAWFNFLGDTLKKGVFKDGLKEGDWYFEKRLVKNNKLTENDIETYVEKGCPPMDTIIEKMYYSKGVRNGFYTQLGQADYPYYEGYYSNNEFTGHWIERLKDASNFSYTEPTTKEELEELRNNKIVTAEYTFSKDKKPVRQAIIRDQLISTDADENYNFYSEFEPYDVSKDLFEIAFEKELDIELEEENANSYEGEEYNEDYDDGDYYDEDYYDGSETNFQVTVYDQKAEKYINRGRAIDSLGVKFNFEGIYERHYSNGQLMFRYEFKDGKLLKEDTIFWDNGKPYDVVTFQIDSNQYIQSIYDYDGKLYHEIVYDDKGDFKRVKFQPNYTKYVLIDGLLAKDEPDSEFLSYDKMDTLATTLEVDSILIWKSWNKSDSSKLYERKYFPKDRILMYNNYSMTGKKALNGELTFNEDFKSWTGEETYSFNTLTLKSHESASYFPYESDYQNSDTIPQMRVNSYDENFDITTDDVLYNKNEPFSGPVSITFNTDKPNFKTGKNLSFSFPIAMNYISKLEKDYENYKKTGKSKYPFYLNSLDKSEIYEDHSQTILNALFPFLSYHIIYPEVYIDEYEEEPKKYNEKEMDPSAKTIKGYYKDGKPEGNWVVTDQFGKVQVEIPFSKGEINGTVKTYNYAENNEFDSDEEKVYMQDTFPAKKTHYLSYEENYKNGMLNGPSIRYNWLGKVELFQNFKDGLRQGPSFEKNSYAITKMNYLDDALDGYVKTYLTLKGQDSILLYDLNFQNGLLQGESKSYHLNGKLSKRGFFLNGQSIDDYEAYDTLGFKYHYVKFLYSFPVEEKIWEENELSVRYLFDWRDSIYFTPSDITTSESLEAMMGELGLGELDAEYHGRPSFVEKTGIDYHMTKYYPNDTIARDGEISAGKKVGCWKYYNYDGVLLNEVEYYDSIITLNDSIQFKSKGLLTDYNKKGKPIRKSYIIEKFEKYDCSHTDHYEIRQLYTIWEANDSLKFKNGYVKNHYDNGVLQNEGKMVNGLPTGVWKFYDPFGKLNQVGVYVQGKRDGRWLAGDLSKTKYLGDICLNPNLPNLEEEIKTREKLLDIVITNYKLGKALNNEYYDINWQEVEGEEPEEAVEEE